MPSGYFMYHRFSILCPQSALMCFAWIWEKDRDYLPIQH